MIMCLCLSFELHMDYSCNSVNLMMMTALMTMMMITTKMLSMSMLMMKMKRIVKIIMKMRILIIM